MSNGLAFEDQTAGTGVRISKSFQTQDGDNVRVVLSGATASAVFEASPGDTLLFLGVDDTNFEVIADIVPWIKKVLGELVKVAGNKAGTTCTTTTVTDFKNQTSTTTTTCTAG